MFNIKEFQNIKPEKRIGIEDLKIGDGVTVNYYSDRKAATIISKTDKKIEIQFDKQEIDPNWKPEMVPGGFSAICLNQNDQKWICEPDPNGEKQIFTLRKNGKWILRGNNTNNRTSLSVGRHPFYDYNF